MCTNVIEMSFSARLKPKGETQVLVWGDQRRADDGNVSESGGLVVPASIERSHLKLRAEEHPNSQLGLISFSRAFP